MRRDKTPYDKDYDELKEASILFDTDKYHVFYFKDSQRIECRPKDDKKVGVIKYDNDMKDIEKAAIVNKMLKKDDCFDIFKKCKVDGLRFFEKISNTEYAQYKKKHS